MEPAGGGQLATRRPASLGLLALLYSSLLLNAIFLAHHFLSPSRLLGGGSCGLTWSLQAAREAEAVAAVECSGHGQVFLDGIAGEDGRPGCECNTCFGGPDCSLRTPNCTADADRKHGESEGTRAMSKTKKHYNFNSGLPMVGSCIRNNYYVPEWHKQDSKEHAPFVGASNNFDYFCFPEKDYNFNFGLPMVGSCIRNIYYVPEWHDACCCISNDVLD